MTRRSLLLWTAATAASIGAATSGAAVAVADPGPGWTITIDAPSAGAVLESKHLEIEGTASHEAGVDGVTVTLVPQGLPPQCSTETGLATLTGDRFAIELDVGCNGPHEIQVRAESAAGSDSAAGEPRTVAVAERPPMPEPPGLDVTAEGGLRASWDPGDDPDADGTILLVNFRQDPVGRGIGEVILPPADRRATVALRTVRWGAGGPGTTISSPESGGNFIADSNPTDPDPDPPPLEPPPATPPPRPPDVASSGNGGNGDNTAPPSNSTPPTTAHVVDGIEGESAASPAQVAIGPEPDWRPSSEIDERAASAAPTGGLVRTSDERPSGFVALLGFALLVASCAGTVVWRNRRPHARP